MSDKRHYSYDDMSKHPSVFGKMVNSKVSQSLKAYRRNSNTYINYIYRFVGDSIQRDISYEHIESSLLEHLKQLNHYRDMDYSKHAKALYDKIYKEKWFHHGTPNVLVIKRKELAELFSIYMEIGDHSRFLLYAALYLWSKAVREKNGHFIVYRPSVLYALAGLERHTAYRTKTLLCSNNIVSIKNTDKSSFIYSFEKDITAFSKNLNIIDGLMVGNPQKQLHIDRAYKETYYTESLNYGILPKTPYPTSHPLISSNNIEVFSCPVGRVTVEGLLLTAFGEKTIRQVFKPKRNTAIFTIKKRVEDSIEKNRPYGMQDKLRQYFSLLRDYRILTEKAVIHGTPVNLKAIRQIQAAFSVAKSNNYSISESEYSYLKYLKDILFNADKSKGTVSATVYLRGSVSYRTQTRHPNLVNWPKKLRYLLRNKTHKAVSFDISGFEIYISLVEAGAGFKPQINVIKQIADYMGLPIAIVKNIIHTKSKGGSSDTIITNLHRNFGAVGRKITKQNVDDTITALYRLYPELKVRKDKIADNALRHGTAGVVPYYNIKIVSISNEKATTAAVAQVDQTIGSSIVKKWATLYAKTTYADRYPIILDWHDNLTLSVPIDTDATVITAIKNELIQCLTEAVSKLGYSESPLLKSEDLTISE
jgi:hypothetical protein